MSEAATLAKGLTGIHPDIYRPDDFAAVVMLVRDHAGITLPESKSMLVYARLAPLVRKAGCTTFSAYLDRVAAEPDECDRAISALTTNHTFFFREAHHFEHFAAVARPALLARLGAGEPVRFWSAGCSSGEETWSLAATLLGPDALAGRKVAKQDVMILATDISSKVLDRARAANYVASDVEAVPEPLVQAWFEQVGDSARVSETLRSIVRFNKLNLMDAWPMRRRFATIFCRNVMIYFDEPTKERLVARFAEAIEPGGYLYIGHSERVTGPAEALFEAVGPTTYRRRAT